MEAQSLRDWRNATALRIAWKTASRWMDVAQLTKQQFFAVTPTMVGIDWLDRTKTTKSDPYRPSRYVLITGAWTRTIYDMIRTLRPNDSVTTLTTTDVTKLLQRVSPELTSYSIRHGAMKKVAEGAAAGKVQPQTVSILAKHKLTEALMANTTIRYVQNPVAIAKIFQTHKATALL